MGKQTDPAIQARWPRWLGGIWWVFLSLSLLCVYHLPQQKGLRGDEVRYWKMAQQILDGGPWHDHLLWPPLQQVFLAAVLALGGRSILAVQLLQLAMLAVVSALVYTVSKRLTGNAVGAEIAAFAILAYPPLVAYTTYLWPEITHLICLWIAVWLIETRGQTYWAPAVAGLSLGLALLFKSLLLVFVPLLMLPLFARLSRGRAIRRSAIVLGVMLAVLLPAAYQSRQLTGSTGIGDSAVFNIWVGLKDGQRRPLVRQIAGPEFARYLRSADSMAERKRIYAAKIRGLVAERGVATTALQQLGKQYFRLLDRKDFVYADLSAGMRRGGKQNYRDPPTWFVAVVTIVGYGLYAATLFLAPLGAAMMRWRANPTAWVLLAFLIYNAALFFLLHAKPRYQIQFLPVLFLFAGHAIACFVERAGTSAESGNRRLPDRPVLAAALGCGVLLLFLAFGGTWVDQVWPLPR
jgi:4-amino-4-deoxy-L-arabinose transferase-like glycosyltransferase